MSDAVKKLPDPLPLYSRKILGLLQTSGPHSTMGVMRCLGIRRWRVYHHVLNLMERDLVIFHDGKYRLTEKGQAIRHEWYDKNAQSVLKAAAEYGKIAWGGAPS